MEIKMKMNVAVLLFFCLIVFVVNFANAKEDTCVANAKVVEEAKKKTMQFFKLFGDGKINELKMMMSDDISWMVGKQGTPKEDPNVPWQGKYSGKAGVEDFIKTISQTNKFELFTPQDVTVSDDGKAVHVFVSTRLGNLKSGWTGSVPFMQQFKFDSDGLINSISSLYDTELVKSFTNEKQFTRDELSAWADGLVKQWNSGWKDDKYFQKTIKPITTIVVGTKQLGMDEIKKFFESFFVAFKDVHVELENKVLDELAGTVGLIMKVKGRHVGEWKGVKPTNKETTFRIFDFFDLKPVTNQLEPAISTLKSNMQWL